jgi:hypothetical protein
MEDVSIEMHGVAQHELSLLTVVQFWKHLSCVRLDFSGGMSPSGEEAAQLTVSSVFNSLVTEGCFTRLILDGQYRWFHCVPSGEATTGTMLMGYVVGDYVGRATSGGTIHLTTYLWPSVGKTTAYAWHWTLDATALSRSDTLVASVVVESSMMYRSSHATETMSMEEKLRHVERWQHVCELQLKFGHLKT